MRWSRPSEERPPAVAGLFYPAAPEELAELVEELLDGADADATAPRGRIRALIAPHAGFAYSGPVAATAYRALGRQAPEIRRVVLLGPAHRVAFAGVAAPSHRRFATPLGPVDVDREAIGAIESLPGVRVWDAPHAEEHGLEVHLPFLLAVLGRDVGVVPLVVGEAGAEDVAEIVERLWDESTLVVVSSDLSHFEGYESAREHDARTATAIEAARSSDVGPRDACGCRPLAGLLRLADRRGLRVRTLDLRSSGDTAGSRDRVVGYGAFLVEERTTPETGGDVDDPGAA